MDESERALRRLSRRERRLLRRLQFLAPICAVGLAAMLSAGVIKVMEVPREPEAPAKPVVLEADATAGAWAERSLLASDPRLDLSGTLGVSVLDREIQIPPEENFAWEEDPETEAEPKEEIGPLSMRPPELRPSRSPG